MVILNKNKIEKMALALIKEHKIVFISDLCCLLPVSRATFYNYELDKLDTIKEALDNNRISLKSGLRNKWYESNNSTLQIALYKLLGDNEERNVLNNNIISDPEKGMGTLDALVVSLNNAFRERNNN
jgi:hypothetical protein